MSAVGGKRRLSAIHASHRLGVASQVTLPAGQKLRSFLLKSTMMVLIGLVENFKVSYNGMFSTASKYLFTKLKRMNGAQQNMQLTVQTLRTVFS